MMDFLPELIGESPGIVVIREEVKRLLEQSSDARCLPPILLLGEAATGKRFLAYALHHASPRRIGPFIDVHCAAIPEHHMEAELFGLERGAVTDARLPRSGLLQAANTGTIFFDEIGLLPPELHGKLLTVIEERTVHRLGSTCNEPVDVWIIASSNLDLAAIIRNGIFREDLDHRLAVPELALPPLRARGDDIVVLADHYQRRISADYGCPMKRLAPDACAALRAYRWPGNVRELRHGMDRVTLLGEGEVVTAVMLALPGTGVLRACPSPLGLTAPR